jgi:hypothetical protein
MFKENALYYQCEQVYWEQALRPVVSTWAFLGKQLLASGSKPDGTVGYVFAYCCPRMRLLATPATRVFWELPIARETMLSYADFRRVATSHVAEEPQRRSTPKAIRLDGIFSLVDAVSTPVCGGNLPDSIADTKVYCKGSLYYGTSLADEPRGVICRTYLCEGAPPNIQCHRRKTMTCPLLFSDVFSRGLGLERFGTPVLCWNAHRADWEDWCTGLPETIEKIEDLTGLKMMPFRSRTTDETSGDEQENG